MVVGETLGLHGIGDFPRENATPNEKAPKACTEGAQETGNIPEGENQKSLSSVSVAATFFSSLAAFAAMRAAFTVARAT